MAQRVVVITGSAMIDQFNPWYFGVAFAFLFKYCTGMPDMPAFAEKTRHRRADDAPRIEIAAWVRAMARRVEAQLSRDWLSASLHGTICSEPTLTSVGQSIRTRRRAARGWGA